MLCCTDGGAEGDGGESVPGQTVSDRRSHRAHHEDEEDTESQPPHHRALQPAQVPSQGNVTYSKNYISLNPQQLCS